MAKKAAASAGEENWELREARRALAAFTGQPAILGDDALLALLALPPAYSTPPRETPPRVAAHGRRLLAAVRLHPEALVEGRFSAERLAAFEEALRVLEILAPIATNRPPKALQIAARDATAHLLRLLRDGRAALEFGLREEPFAASRGRDKLVLAREGGSRNKLVAVRKAARFRRAEELMTYAGVVALALEAEAARLVGIVDGPALAAEITAADDARRAAVSAREIAGREGVAALRYRAANRVLAEADEIVATARYSLRNQPATAKLFTRTGTARKRAKRDG